MFTSTTNEVQQKALKKDNVGSAAGVTSKTWNVINNTGTDLVVIDAFLKDPSPIDELYQRSLQFLYTSENKSFIKAGETKKISFGETHTDSNGNVEDYTIIIARADNLFPVKIVELPVSEDQGNYTATTVTASDVKLMKQAESFVQTLIAFPSSEMTVGFADVLADPDQQKIDAFFKAYPQYGAISLEMVAAVQTYYNRYGYVWAGYKSAQSYTLYTSDGTTKRNLGSLAVNSPAVPVTNLNAPAGFIATYMDKDHRKTVLHYSGGQFSEDVNSSSPKICLQGLFILKSQLTGEEADNSLIPVMYGVVNGAEVFGFTENAPALSVASTKSTVNSLLSPKDYWGWLKLCGLCVGALVLIAGSIGAVVYIRNKIRKNKASAQAREEVERLTRQKASDIVNRMAAANVVVPGNLDAAFKDIKAEANANLLDNGRANLLEIISKQQKLYERLIQYGVTDDLSKVCDNLIQDEFKIRNGTSETVADNMKTYRERIKWNATSLNDRFDAIDSKFTGEARVQMIDYLGEVGNRTSWLDTTEDIRRDLNNDKLPELIIEE